MPLSAIDRLRSEFKQKEAILADYGDWLSCWSFYAEVFHDADPALRVMVVEAGRRFVALPLEDAIEYSWGRDDVYISAVHFWDDCKKDDLIDYIYAFVVDLDNLSPRWLRNILDGILERGTAPVPSLIVNSGKGVHFYYVLDEPLYVYPSVRKKARQLYSMLHEMFEFAPDKHSIGHAFRPVGASTKIGTIASGYTIGERWSVVELADAVGYNWYVPDMSSRENLPATEKMVRYAKVLAARYNLPEPDFANFVKTHDFIRALSKKQGEQSQQPKIYDHRLTDVLEEVEPNGSPRWYSRVRDRIIEKTELEHRYKSLMALAVIAYKCKIPYEQLVRDMEHITQVWRLEPRWAKDPFNEKNVGSALRCYSPKFVRVRRATLEDWLGWQFQGKKKEPKYGSQEEWLETLAGQRSGSSLRAIRKVLAEDPTLSKTEIARRTGLSRQTVYNHYAAAMAYIEKNK